MRTILRARDKRFSEGDKVIVFDDDMSGKMCKRWHGRQRLFR